MSFPEMSRRLSVADTTLEPNLNLDQDLQYWVNAGLCFWFYRSQETAQT